MNENFFSRLYHQNSKRINKMIPFDDSLWPEEWKTTYYKRYLRLPKINLEEADFKFDLCEAIKNRSSSREMQGDKISNRELSILLKFSCGKTGQRKNGSWKRAYPSGGARYSIEIYGLIMKPGDGLRSGIFHYDVKDHQIEMLSEKEIGLDELKDIASYDFINNSSVLFFMTSIFDRSQNKYGDRGYRFILQEAGHIGQNFYLVSEALGLKCCSVGGFRVSDDEIEKILHIDGISESIVYSIAIGK